MKYLSKKLNSQKGASIFIALMLFLVCVMVGSVILSSSAANIDKIRQRDESQKSYLSVSSAAMLLKDILGGQVYKGWETNTVYECYGELSAINPAKHTDKAEVCTEMQYDTGTDTRIRQEVGDMIYQAFLSNTKYVPQVSVADTLTKEFTISGSGMYDVNIKMHLNTSTYILTCSLAVKDDANLENSMTLLFKAAVTDPSKDDADKAINAEADNVHQVLRELTDEYGSTYWDWINVYYDITVYTVNTTIMYDPGTITKGETL